MGSRQRSGLPLTGRAPTTPVLVNLDALFPTGQSATGQSATGHPTPADQSSATDDRRLHLRGWAVGTLHRWLRSATGDWIGVCTVLISRGDGSTYRADDQLVPAQALRQRTT